MGNVKSTSTSCGMPMCGEKEDGQLATQHKKHGKFKKTIAKNDKKKNPKFTEAKANLKQILEEEAYERQEEVRVSLFV